MDGQAAVVVDRLGQRRYDCLGGDAVRDGDLHPDEPHGRDASRRGDRVGDTRQRDGHREVEGALGQAGGRLGESLHVLGGEDERPDQSGVGAAGVLNVGRDRLLDRQAAGWEDRRVIEQAGEYRGYPGCRRGAHRFGSQE